MKDRGEHVMDMQKVDMFIMTNQKYLPAEKIRCCVIG